MLKIAKELAELAAQPDRHQSDVSTVPKTVSIVKQKKLEVAEFIPKSEGTGLWRNCVVSRTIGLHAPPFGLASMAAVCTGFFGAVLRSRKLCLSISLIAPLAKEGHWLLGSCKSFVAYGSDFTSTPKMWRRPRPSEAPTVSAHWKCHWGLRLPNFQLASGVIV